MWHFLHNKRRSSYGGFSLIELLVAVAIFAIVMTIAIGTLLTLIDANRKAQTLKSVMNNLNFALDSISRTIRTGQLYRCSNNEDADDDVPISEGLPCPTGATSISLYNDQGVRAAYRFNSTDKSIERKIEDEVVWTAMTAPEVMITDMKFYVKSADEGDGKQPIVTIAINGDTGFSTKVDSTFQIQTTVTQRDLEDRPN